MKIEVIDPLALTLPYALMRLAGLDVRPFWYRMSGLGWCPLKQKYTMEGREERPVDAYSKRVMQIGQFMEQSVLDEAMIELGGKIAGQQAECAFVVTDLADELGATSYWLGHIDAEIVVDGETIVIDSKATSSFAYRKYEAMTPAERDMDRTISAYKAQIGAYALARGRKGACLAVRNRDTSSKEVVWEDSIYRWSEADYRRDVERGIKAHHTSDIKAVEVWECNYCRFDCPSKKEAQPDHEQAYVLLEQLRAAEDGLKAHPFTTFGEYEEMRKKADSLADKARVHLKELPASLRKPMHGGYKLSWSATNRLTITDTRKGERE